MDSEAMREIQNKLSSIGHMARILDSEKDRMLVFCDVLLRRLIKPGETLYIPREEWAEAMNHPKLCVEVNEKDYSDWGWYLSLKEELGAE